MITESNIAPAKVSTIDPPRVPLSVVVVPTDRGQQFTIEGPDPASHDARIRHRFERLDSAIRQDCEQTAPALERDVVASVHRVEH